MRRVWGIYLMRQVMKPGTRLTAFLAVCLAIASSVSMPNIIRNALQSHDLVRFSLSAVTSTTFAIQLGVLMAGAILIWTLFDAVRPRSHAPLPL